MKYPRFITTKARMHAFFIPLGLLLLWWHGNGSAWVAFLGGATWGAWYSTRDDLLKWVALHKKLVNYRGEGE